MYDFGFFGCNVYKNSLRVSYGDSVRVRVRALQSELALALASALELALAFFVKSSVCFVASAGQSASCCPPTRRWWDARSAKNNGRAGSYKERFYV